MTHKPRKDDEPSPASVDSSVDIDETPVTESADAELRALLRDHGHGWGETPLPKPGDVIGEKYRIEKRLGVGGMGAVYRAAHVVSGKLVAVKWILRRTADERVRTRFLREARAAARIDHPNVVNVYDVGEVDSCGYLVMELLHGETLKARLRRTITPREAVALLIPAMRGIMAVHAAGVIHRDLKPDNIFLCAGPDQSPREAKVLDFGVSAFTELDAMDTRLTSDGTVVGTPAYMSPEQLLRPLTVDARSDIYALGVILYEALTGQLPFQADTLPALTTAIVHDPPLPPSQLRPEIPAALSAAVLRALAKQPEERFETVQHLISALDPSAESRAGSRSHKAAAPRFVAIAAAAAALVVLAAFWYLRGPAAAPSQETSTAAVLSTRGFEADDAYLSGAACTACLERGCGAASSACQDDAQCASVVAQARTSSTPLVANRAYLTALAEGRWAVDHQRKEGAWMKPRGQLTQCARARCLAECQIGRKLACVGHFDYPASYPSSAMLRMRLHKIEDSKPLPDWQVNACAPGSRCERSMGSARTDADGWATLAVDFANVRPNTPWLAEFNGSIELRGSAEYSPRVLRQSAPFLDGYYSTYGLSSRDRNRRIHEARGLPTVGERLGNLDVQLQDCDAWIAWGVSFEVWRYSAAGLSPCTDCTVLYPDEQGNPDPTRKSFPSSTKASAVILMPPGEVLVKARDVQTNLVVATLPHIEVRGDYEQSALLFPASKTQLQDEASVR